MILESFPDYVEMIFGFVHPSGTKKQRNIREKNKEKSTKRQWNTNDKSTKHQRKNNETSTTNQGTKTSKPTHARECLFVIQKAPQIHPTAIPTQRHNCPAMHTSKYFTPKKQRQLFPNIFPKGCKIASACIDTPVQRRLNKCPPN